MVDLEKGLASSAPLIHEHLGSNVAAHVLQRKGDYAAAKALFETHGIHFDAKLRDEIVKRVDSLNLPSYQGFVMPKLTAVRGADGTITDVQISYPMDLTKQMLEFAQGAASSQPSSSK